MIIRSLQNLTPYYDGDGARWYALREVCELVREPDTTKASRHIIYGHRRRITVKGQDWRFKTYTHLIDGVALIEICRALSGIPNRDVRAYVAGSAGEQVAVAR